MKQLDPRTTKDKEAKEKLTVLDLNLDEGTSILCTPTGEQWRIASVDSEKISFEKID